MQTRWVLAVVISAVAVIFAAIWWKHGGREVLLLVLQPKFQVVHVNSESGTMAVRRMNEEYVVRCGDNCQQFLAGKSYSMLDRGGVLEFRRGGRKILLPVIQEHVDFDTAKGGRG